MPSHDLSLSDLPAPPSQLTLSDLPPPPTAGSRWKARAESAVAGLEDPISAGAQLVTHMLPAPVVQEGNKINNWLAAKTGMFPHLGPGGIDALQAQRDQQLAQTRQAAGLQGFDWSRLLGNALPWVATPELRTAGLLGHMLLGGASGAVQGALQPTGNGTDFWPQKARQAATGAAIGVIIPGMTRGLSGIIRGVQDPAVKALSKAGVSMTPGQLFGGGLRAGEEKLRSTVPLVGDLINAAERRGVVQYNRAAMDDVLAPLGIKAPTDVPEGYRLVDRVGNDLSDRYDQLVGMLHGELDPKFVQDLAKIRQLSQTLPQDRANQLDQFLKVDVLDRFNPKTGQATGPMLKDIESKLGVESRAYMRSPDPDQRKLGAALQETQLSLRRMLERVNPAQRGQLQKLNASYARFLRVEQASGSTGGTEGLFTPSQLRSAARKLDLSKGKRAFRRGRALMQPFAEQGQQVLAKKVPDSGTAGRAFLGAMALGAPGIWHPVLGLGAAAVPFYTPSGQRVLQALATGDRGPVANAMAALLQRAPTPALTAATLPLLTNNANQQ